MTEDTDFSALYSALGVGPDCTPGQFRQAYRRAVARLHPDQQGGSGDVSRLQELNRQYGIAMGFLRTHGRLPGASARPLPASKPDVAGPATPRQLQAAYGNAESVETDKAGEDRSSRYFVWLAVLAIAVLAVHALEPLQDSKPQADGPDATQDGHARPAGTITLGMGKQQVKAIQGDPTSQHGLRWNYGPSWVEFRCGDVATDWYSSPQQPLHAETKHPSDADWDRFDARPPHGC